MKMESKEFVKMQIEKLSKKYPFTTIKYYFDSFDNDHFICVDSKTDLDNIYSKQAWDIDKEFISNFPNELLSFMLLEDYLEFGESGKLVYEKTYRFSKFEINNKNINLFSVKNKNDFRYKQKLEFTLKQNNEEKFLLLEEDYASAA